MHSHSEVETAREVFQLCAAREYFYLEEARQHGVEERWAALKRCLGEQLAEKESEDLVEGQLFVDFLEFAELCERIESIPDEGFRVCVTLWMSLLLAVLDMIEESIPGTYISWDCDTVLIRGGERIRNLLRLLKEHRDQFSEHQEVYGIALRVAELGERLGLK